GAHRYLSKIHLLKNRDKEAILEMEKEVENNPQNYTYVLELAELYMHFKEWDKAVDMLSRVTNLPSPEKAPQFREQKMQAYLLLSKSFRAKRKPVSAEGAIRLALRIDPKNPELHRKLGYVYYAQQRDKEGVEAFEYFLKETPKARDTA